MKRHATAVWRGGGPDGSGTLDMQSGVFKSQPYSARMRFESEDGRAGTNPEELIAAAHAGCFSMALAFALGAEGIVPEELSTTAEVDLQKTGGGFAIAGIALTLRARIPGIDPKRFAELAEGAKANCPVSRALSATPITLDARLL